MIVLPVHEQLDPVQLNKGLFLSVPPVILTLPMKKFSGAVIRFKPAAFISSPIAVEVICIPLTGCVTLIAANATGPDVGTDGPISRTKKLLEMKRGT